jgi:hypothetical protein
MILNKYRWLNANLPAIILIKKTVLIAADYC